MNLLLKFELVFLNNLSDWLVMQNEVYNLNRLEHEQILLHHDGKIQSFLV